MFSSKKHKVPSCDHFSLELLVLFFFLFAFLGPYLHHMEVPSLGVQSDLQLWAYATATWDLSHVCMTYTTAHGNAGSLTHGVRPGMEFASSGVHYC